MSLDSTEEAKSPSRASREVVDFSYWKYMERKKIKSNFGLKSLSVLVL